MSANLETTTQDATESGSSLDRVEVRSHAISTASLGQRAPSEPAALPVSNPTPGDRVDRYVILRRLGSTRHSDVYSGHDPELDRKVALKLLSVGAVDELDGYRRLMAEAQATARLAHPNVVRVHDVGTWRGRPFVAREFIEGASVYTWKRRAKPTRTEILRVMLLGGRGVSALHKAGLVHRDLNLHAILVGDDGSVRVTDMDFVGSVENHALSSAMDGETLDSRDIESRDSVELPLSFSADSLGREDTTGSFVRAAGLSGVFEDSPYASPEQLLGRVADARSDQFSFCLALYEALFDASPFGSGTAARRLARMERGRVRMPKGPCSGRTIAAIKIGLSIEPEDRYPDMDALLRALTPRRRHWALLIPAAVGAATVAAVTLVSSPEAASYCASIESQLDGVWDEQRKGGLSDAFRRAGLPYADDLHAFTERRLDAWVDEWIERHDALCETPADAPNVTEVAREMHCLSLRREEFGSVVEALVVGDKRSIENAALIVRELSSVASCSDPEQWLKSRDQIEEATTLGRGLTRLSTLLASDRLAEAMPLAEVLVDQARSLGHGPTLVRALSIRAHLLDRAHHADAESALHEALSEALAQGEYASVASAATSLASAHVRRREFEEGLRWLDHAEAALARGVVQSEPGYAGVENVRGRIAQLKGEFAEALRHYQRALQLRIEAVGAADDRVALYRVNIGQAYQDLGRYAEARGEYEAALIGVSQALGPLHPDVAKTHMALCAVMSHQGEYEAGLEHGREAISILESAYGNSRAEVADAMLSAAMAHSGLGRMEQSIALQEKALEIYKATVGERSFRVALVMNNLGVEHGNAGKYEEAEANYREAVAIAGEALGVDHVRTANLRATHIAGLLALGRYDEAEAALPEVLATLEAKAGADHPMLAPALNYQGEVDAVRGRAQEAIEHLEQAIAIYLKTGEVSAELGRARLMLATQLRRVGRVQEADAVRDDALVDLRSRAAWGKIVLIDVARFEARLAAMLSD